MPVHDVQAKLHAIAAQTVADAQIDKLFPGRKHVGQFQGRECSASEIKTQA